MPRSGVSWRTQAMAWPLIAGAGFGSYLALQFADSSDIGSVVGAVALGSLCSLPAGALLGISAILAGKGVLAIGEHNSRAAAPTSWRLAFAITTAVVTAVIVVTALSCTTLDDEAIGASALAIATISFVAPHFYYPATDSD
ncbi:hypothetical protein FFI94_014300 [Rhodococcus sp. KBS0724]|uniref:hypothetical protein n=1 Tax=Rhodococcus sp. KBS0724 TaxID=1179674 RepID=UPI00110D92D1|nr:hypothetical protein [Rhodococcus sp. KBS0724]TSD47212.1 hypothetical protein FFI94_014300 [Rhodococcus sp. KBS0724]